MNKQQPIQIGDQFKDVSGDLYTVYARDFGDQLCVRIENESMLTTLTHTQLRQMQHVGRSDMRHLIAGGLR
jgi:hypothetical protein